jgi:hypothetical protein
MMKKSIVNVVLICIILLMALAYVFFTTYQMGYRAGETDTARLLNDTTEEPEVIK